MFVVHECMAFNSCKCDAYINALVLIAFVFSVKNSPLVFLVSTCYLVDAGSCVGIDNWLDL